MPARSLSTHSAHSATRGSSAGNSPIARRTGTKQSEDDEQIAGELMGEWLTGLPPTMPFHRGQVLIIPQSPYIHAKKSKGRTVLKTRTDMIQLESEDEAKSKKAGGDSVSHKKTSGDVNEEAAEEQEAGEKTVVKERFIYVSPAEKQIQRECSELHDVLQHSQARIVAEKTRRHRFLDSDRMSRSDLLAAKHAAFMERKRKAESKESAALAAMNTPRANSNYEMMVHSADEQPSGDVVQIKPQGKLMTPRPPEGITPRPPTGPRLIRPASNHGAGTGVGAEESPHHARLRHLPEPGENVPLPPTSARRSGAEDPEFSMSRDKSILKKPGTSGSAHHTHWGQKNGAETERILSAKSDAVWSEPGNGKVSLENFEQYPGKRINSPHSVVAMKRFGVVQEDLERRPDSYYESITAAQLRGPRPASSRQDTSAEEQSRIAHMRLDFDERSRKRLLEKLITERRRHLNAQAVLIMENTYGEPPAPELKAFGHAARANYLEGPSENGQRKQVRGVMTYVDEMASALIEKGRSKVLRNQVMERKRMQAMLKSHIKSKDHIEDLQEKLGEKVGNKAVFMAERQQKIAMDREQKARRSLERQSDTYGNANQNYAEKMRYLNDKMERAAQTSQEANNRVRRRLQDTALLQAMKHELHQQRVLQAARAADYQRDVGEEKAARAQRNYDKLSEKREQISQEHLALKHQLLTERRFISAMVEGFEQTGEFRKISNAPDLSEIIGDILEIDSTEMQKFCKEDRNKDAQELTRNQWCKGNVRKGSYTYFKFKHACSRAPNRINIFLKTTKGDPDMYIGNHLVPYPCKDDFVWKVATFGDDKCTIHPFDKGFVLGYLYVGVYGYCDSEFSIKVRWNEAGDAAAPHMPGRQRSISEENSFESHRSLKSRQQNQFKRQASAERKAEISEAEENNKTKAFDVASFDWSVLCAWLRMIDVDEAAVQVVEKEKVPGAQLANMSLDELISDLGMSKLQAKRVMMHTSGLVPSHSLSSHSLNSANSNTQVSAQNSLEKDVTETKPAEDPAPSAQAGEWDPLFAENGEGALGNVDDVKDS